MGDETVLKTSATQRIRERVDPIGHFLAEGFHFLGLFAIGGATVWAAVKAFFDMSAPGLVSRASPVQTATRNCMRDEGRPFEVGNQVLISSHRKLLSTKAMVVNVAEKSEQDFGRHD